MQPGTRLGPYEITVIPQSAYGHICPLADGRVVLGSTAAGRSRLVAVEAGKDPVRLVTTNEETAPPVTSAGPFQVAFLIGAEPRDGILNIRVALSPTAKTLRQVPFFLRVSSTLSVSCLLLVLATQAGVWPVATSPTALEELGPAPPEHGAPFESHGC